MFLKTAIRRGLIIAATLPIGGACQAELARGRYVFSSERQCSANGAFPAQICALARENADAEFNEKAPRFPTREACTKHFPAGCSIGFHGATGYAGKKSSVYFLPRQQGFRIDVKSDRDARVVPVGVALPFTPRSALVRDASIKPGVRDLQTKPGTSAPASFGLAVPEGAKGPLPPPPPVDPNFDCAAVLEPGADPRFGCAPVRTDARRAQ